MNVSLCNIIRVKDEKIGIGPVHRWHLDDYKHSHPSHIFCQVEIVDTVFT